jgi:toxin ParE1/3/4
VAQRVVWAESAAEDLREAANFIERDSHSYAAALVRQARAASRSLSVFHERGRVVPESSRPDVREIFVHSYRLIYQIRGDLVAVVAFVHGARDLAALWERTPPDFGKGA